MTPTLSSDRAKFEFTARLLAWVMYPLATVMVLRRPNVGPVPAWLERRIAAWPAWFRARKNRTSAEPFYLTNRSGKPGTRWPPSGCDPRFGNPTRVPRRIVIVGAWIWFAIRRGGRMSDLTVSDPFYFTDAGGVCYLVLDAITRRLVDGRRGATGQRRGVPRVPPGAGQRRHWMTQPQVARALGIAHPQVSRMETGNGW